MPTITVRRFDYETLKSKLAADARIVILSCDACAKLSADLGGEQGLESLSDKLLADGFSVVHRELLPIACAPDQLSDRLEDDAIRELFEDADVIIPLACQAGEKRAQETIPGSTILTVTRTLGKGSFSPEAGARLTEPLEDVALKVDDPEGMSVAEASERLGLHSGSF